MDDWHLIVGLGNPGPEYARTRHNAGFMLLDRLADHWQVAWQHEKRFQSRLGRTERNGRRLLLCQSQTFMNLSGVAVAALVKYYRLPLGRLLVVVDDADLPLGHLRLRPAGSSGGHHGLDSIERHLGSRQYPRLRIGIGRQDERREIAGYVLGRLTGAELAVMERVLARAQRQVECWLERGLQPAMNQFNGAVTAPNNEGIKQ